MEESDGIDLGVKGLSLIDLSSENDSLVVDVSSSFAGCGLTGHQSSETQYDARSFALGAVDGDKVVDLAHTLGWSEQLPLLLETSEPKRTRKIGKCNLRKSLAWDSAFFTNLGVLDPEELSSMIEGAEKGKKHLLPLIEEDICRSTNSISTLKSDNMTPESCEIELFEDIGSSIQKSSKTSNMENSSSKATSGETGAQAIYSAKKVDLASRNKLKPKLASKMITIGMQKSGKTVKQGSGCPQVTQSVVRIGDSSSSHPRPPRVTSRVNPISTVTTKKASLGASHVNIENDNAKSTTGSSKGTQASKVTGLRGPHMPVSKPVLSSKSSSLGSTAATKTQLAISSSSCESSGSTSSRNIGKYPSTSARRKIDSRTVSPPSSGSIPKITSKIASRNKTQSENSGLPAYLLPSKLSSNIPPASSISEWSSESSLSSSTVNQRSKSMAGLDTSSSRCLDSDAPPALGLNTHSNDRTDGNENQVTGLPTQNIKKASTQTGTPSRPASMRPLGLRMPSPKIGFFDGAKPVALTPNRVMQPQSRLPTGLPKIKAGINNPIGSSNKAKVGKLPSTTTVTQISKIKPSAQKSASPKPFREPLSGSTKVSGRVSCLKSEAVGTGGPDTAQHVTDPSLDAEKNNRMSLNMKQSDGLKDQIKIRRYL